MKYRPRIYYSDTQKTLMWDRMESGRSRPSMAFATDRHPVGHPRQSRISSGPPSANKKTTSRVVLLFGGGGGNRTRVRK